MDQKASGGIAALPIIAIILAVIVFGMFLVNLASRQCNSNRDCPGNAYCGTDYECHEFPQQIVTSQNNFLPAALIFGGSIILAAFILRWKKNGLGSNHDNHGGHGHH